MKLNKIFYSFMATTTLLLTACTPDKYDLGDKDVTSADLVEGTAYSVTVDQNTNTVVLKSLMADRYDVSWVHPQGRAQEKEVTLRIPFDGEYEVTFGVKTRGGVVYGAPYKFTLNNINPDLLTDPMWTLLSGGVGKSKSWQLDLDKDGVSKYFAGPLYFYGKLCYWLEEHVDKKKEHGQGTEAFPSDDCWNWNADWAGQSSWLLGGTGAMDYGTITFDLINGAHAMVDDKAHGTKNTGKFLIDPEEHTMKLIDVSFPHDPGRDGIVTKWGEIRIFSITEHTMQLGVLRDNDPSEGPCYLVYNFISTDAYEDPSLLPTEEAKTIEASVPQLPEFENLLHDLYTTDINGVDFTGAEITFNVNGEAAYDWLWWNGGSTVDKTVDKWESVVKGNYGTSWAPQWGEDATDVELVLGKEVWEDKNGKKKSSKTADTDKFLGYAYTLGDDSGVFNIDGSKLVFDEEVTFFKVEGTRTIDLTGKEWQVLRCEPGTEVVLGIPAGTDSKNYTNSYLVVNLTYKAVGGGQTGPTVVPITHTEAEHMWVENGCIRLGFHHYGVDGTGIFTDVSSVKLKKKQTITVTFKLTGAGITWTNAPKCALIDNNIKTTWEPDCFNLDDAVTVDINGGETTVKLTNTTNSSQTFVDTCLDLSIQLEGYGKMDNPDDYESIGLEVVSCTIE